MSILVNQNTGTRLGYPKLVYVSIVSVYEGMIKALLCGCLCDQPFQFRVCACVSWMHAQRCCWPDLQAGTAAAPSTSCDGESSQVWEDTGLAFSDQERGTPGSQSPLGWVALTASLTEGAQSWAKEVMLAVSGTKQLSLTHPLGSNEKR